MLSWVSAVVVVGHEGLDLGFQIARQGSCPYRKSNPDVLMVQTSEVRDDHDAASRSPNEMGTTRSRSPCSARIGERSAKDLAIGGGAFLLFVRFTRARGGAERRAESCPSCGPGRRRFLFAIWPRRPS